MSAPYGKPVADLAMAERQQKIVTLKRDGLSFQQIADQLGISKAAAIRGFQAVKRRVDTAADDDYIEYKSEQLARIATMREVVADIVAARHVTISNGHVVREIIGRDDEGEPEYGDPYEDHSPVLAAIDRLVKLDDQEAKLLGLYPKQAVSISRETSEVDAAVIGLIQRAQDRADTLRARIDDSGGQQE
jgi:hypothetical protein